VLLEMEHLQKKQKREGLKDQKEDDKLGSLSATAQSFLHLNLTTSRLNSTKQNCLEDS
jgi:hypothetical protein